MPVVSWEAGFEGTFTPSNNIYNIKLDTYVMCIIENKKDVK